MKVWTVSNQKGGVGKTTTVVSLGGLLSSWGFRVLLVDLDPHGALTSYFKMNPDTIETSVYNLFHDASEKKGAVDPAPYIVQTGFDGLSILPAATAIATLDRQVASLGGMGLVITHALGRVSDQYDYVLIDSPPMLGVLMVNALAACEQLVIPVLAEFLALKGLERMMHTLKMVFRSRKDPPRITIVTTMFDKRTNEGQESLRMIKSDFSQDAWDEVIPIDTKLREASRAGIPPSTFAPASKGVLAYSDLLEHLLPYESNQSKK